MSAFRYPTDAETDELRRVAEELAFHVAAIERVAPEAWAAVLPYLREGTIASAFSTWTTDEEARFDAAWSGALRVYELATAMVRECAPLTRNRRVMTADIDDPGWYSPGLDPEAVASRWAER